LNSGPLVIDTLHMHVWVQSFMDYYTAAQNRLVIMRLKCNTGLDRRFTFIYFYEDYLLP
jgi:hypothetical protein